MVEEEIDRLLPPTMARDLKWMIKEHENMNVGSLVDMLEFIENNPQVLKYNDLQIRVMRGRIIITWHQLTMTFYGERRYNICGYHIGRHLDAADYTLRIIRDATELRRVGERVV